MFRARHGGRYDPLRRRRRRRSPLLPPAWLDPVGAVRFRGAFARFVFRLMVPPMRFRTTAAVTLFCFLHQNCVGALQLLLWFFPPPECVGAYHYGFLFCFVCLGTTRTLYYLARTSTANLFINRLFPTGFCKQIRISGEDQNYFYLVFSVPCRTISPYQ
jgi:hypothetical protein